jgi:hypothetical protein
MTTLQIFGSRALTFSDPRRFLTQRRFIQTNVDGSVPRWGMNAGIIDPR